MILPEMICFALYSANHAMQRVYQPLLAPLGLTYPQFLVLMVLWAEDGRTVGDLGRALQLESNTLTPLLKRMEAQGLVSRTRVAEDERQVRVALTDKGSALQEQAAGITGCIFDACGVAVEELTALRDQIKGLRDRLRSTG
ncbi:MAG: MarR family winged helix-turn-helix transcriptional regulator [Cypionkella sp.]